MRLKWNNVGQGIAALAEGYQEGNKKRAISAIEAGLPKEYTSGYALRDATPEQLAAYEAENIRRAKEDAAFLMGSPVNGTEAPEQTRAWAESLQQPGAYEYGQPKQAEAIRAHEFMGNRSDSPISESVVRRLKDEGIAGVMAKYGDYQGARALRRDLAQDDRYAKQDQRADSAEQRAAAADTRAQALHGMTMDKTQIELDQAKAQQASRERIAKFGQKLSALNSEGKKPTIAELRSMAYADGLNDDDVFKVATSVTGMDELQTKAETMDRTRLFDESARNGLPGLIDLYDNHPLFDDGKKMTVKRDKSGVTLLDGGRVVASGADDGEVVAYLRKWMVDPVNAVMFKLDVDSKKASIASDKANAVQKYASAAESYAGAANQKARTAQTNFETAYMKKNGIKPGASGGAGKSSYKVEMGEVATAFGRPAVDEDGKPIMDVMTGRQVVNRNVADETKFFKWMEDNGITDTNEGLAKYISGGSGRGSGASGYQQYLGAFNKAKAAGNQAAMKALTEAARAKGIVK